jgi:hypothetical protein
VEGLERKGGGERSSAATPWHMGSCGYHGLAAVSRYAQG